jgi:hypothetical protein
MGKACNMHEKRNAYSFLVGKREGKRLLKDLDIAGRVILKWILER